MACKCGQSHCVCLNDPLDMDPYEVEQSQPPREPGRPPWEDCED